MNRAAGLILALLFLAAMPAACEYRGSGEPTTNPPEERTLPAEVTEDAAAVVEAAHQFAFDLHRALRDREGNLFFSPYSLSTALTMTYAGTGGKTQEEMARVLHLGLPPERLHHASGAIQMSLDRGSDGLGYEVRIANRLWGAMDASFLESFLSVTREEYGAEIEQVDFAGAPDDARRVINAWVEENTNRRIQDLLPPGSIDGLTRLVLTNAIYFKGLWASPFDPEATRDQLFHVDATHSVEVAMMHQDGRFAHAHADGMQILELPYKDDLAMIVLLPDATDGLSDLESKLTKESLQVWMESMQETRIDIALPRFSITSELELNQTLARLGMPSAFDPDLADFSGINGQRDLFIHAVIHKAFVEVNEEGTEAAAATGVTVGVTSMGPMFVADHPFLFVIRDKVTGSILFLGRVANPLG